MDDQASPRNPTIAVALIRTLAGPRRTVAKPGRLKAVVLISRSGTELANLDWVKAFMQSASALTRRYLSNLTSKFPVPTRLPCLSVVRFV